MGKKIKDTCCLCGEVKVMTYEHVPPKATNNDKPLKMYDGLEVLASNKNEGQSLEGFRYINQQRGAGDYTLCATCNNFIGDKYNQEYKRLVNDLEELIKYASNENPYMIEVKTKPMDLMAIFKQIMAMFCSISSTCANDKKLREFILDEMSTDFDFEKYRVYLYGVHKYSKFGRIVGDSVIVKENKQNLMLSEISLFPIGLILSMGKINSAIENDIKGVDITSFATFCYGEENQIELNIPVQIISSEVVCRFDND